MDCINNYIATDDRLNGMLRASGNLVGLPITEVSGHTSAVPCSHNHLTFEQLMLASIGVDGCGKPALRVKNIDSCTLALTCAQPKGLIDMFAYDATLKTFALVLNKTA
jgi:hypothetical protein